jgi:NADPH-dependent 2,4-dienoyl-CoA reductase/sulfur reductase-like enzyme
VQEARYLIVGGGLAGDGACRGIREQDEDGSIVLVGDEEHPPYARPPLSKALWAGKDEETIWRKTDELGVDLRLGRRIVSLDLDARTARDDRGDEYRYERLLLATGGTPRRLPDSSDGVVYFRTVDDFRRLRSLAGDGTRAVVVGGGFIGSEIAAALASNGCAVTMVFPEAGIGARIFPADLSAFLNGYYREHGVEVLESTQVDAVEDGFRVRLGSGAVVEAEVVVAGLGIVPNDELAAAAGLPVDNGIVVDERGRAGGRDDVFAAGDVARFPAEPLGGALRVEHEDHAKSHGKLVGANMAGAERDYDYLPFFYSDLFELGYEAVGDTDARLETVAEWADPHRKGVVAYVDAERRPRGFLLWDVWGKLDAARELIHAREPVDADAVRGLLG